MYSALSSDISELLDQTKMLKDQIKKSIPDSLRISHASNNEVEPLTRDEVAKLLLVVSKAFSISHISSEQRG